MNRIPIFLGAIAIVHYGWAGHLAATAGKENSVPLPPNAAVAIASTTSTATMVGTSVDAVTDAVYPTVTPQPLRITLT
jgi:hypothetical protein